MSQRLVRLAVVLATMVAATTVSAAADEFSLSIANGRVTLIAKDVPLRQILNEWARLGDTRIVNAEKLASPPLTLQLIDMPERQALDILLKSASGYMAAPRPVGAAGASMYDRIMILATSRPPTQSASVAPPAFNRPMTVPPQPMPDDDNDTPDQVVPPPGVTPQGPQGMMPPGAVAPGTQPQSQPNPGMLPQQPGQQAPTTLDRPGMLPAPPATPGNPYQQYPQQPQQPVRRPGGNQ